MSIPIKASASLHNPVDLLSSFWEKMVLIGFCSIFSILFINIYMPFGINTWESDQGWTQFVRLSGFGIIGGIFLAISQFVIKPWVFQKCLTLLSFSLWIVFEIAVLALVFFFLFGDRNNNFLLEYFICVKHTFLGLLIPYTLALCFVWIFKTKKEKAPMSQAANAHQLVGFKDEYGNTKISLKASDILFIEAADNYVTIHFEDRGTVNKEMVRNSLKAVAELVIDLPIKRCHRSFLVNVQKVKIAKKNAGKLSLQLENTASIIPVSRNFAPDFQYLLE